MISTHRQTAVRKGSWRWAIRVAELTAWGTVAFILLLLHVADLSRSTYRVGLALTVGLAAWLVLFFRILIHQGDRRLVTVGGIVVHLAFAGSLFAVLRADIGSAQLVFVPVIVATGLLANLPGAIGASVLATIGYLWVAAATGPRPSTVSMLIHGGTYILSGLVAGLLARELRSHYQGELKEHQLATAVRHRLLAVLDAVDEAIVFRDRQGVARVVNRRAGELFDVEPDDHLGLPMVELLRSIARKTEDPEGFMEVYQQLRDEPEAELRLDIEQILPTRRQLRLYSSPTFDDDSSLVGRIDVFTDVTENVSRAAEVERLYEQARKTAESYQRALLPDSLPNMPRVSVVAHYIAAAGTRAVCGDFYDFIPLPDGRLAIALGDVCGIGPKAANDAALTRYTLRSYAREESDPARLLERMNEQIHLQCESERFVRLLIGALDPERAVFEYGNSGHVPPILHRYSDGSVTWLGEGGIALGIEPEASYKADYAELHPGDMLVFYTDGLTEAARNGHPFGQGKLADLVQEYGVGTPGELAQALRRAVDAWVSDDELRDDLAIVVCQVVPDRTLGEPTRELVLPNAPERVAEVRSFVGSFLADLRAPIDTSAEILLAVGEAAANAHRHGRKEDGRSEIRVFCAVEGRRFSVTIADDGPGFDPAMVEAAGLPDRFSSGGRGLFLMRELMEDVSVERVAGGTAVVMTRELPPVTPPPRRRDD